jgi:hypothetical protein
MGYQMKRERLFNAYKVILNAADKYQFETQQINHMPSAVNLSLDGLDEAVTEITLEDIDFGVLSIFFDLRGAFNEFTARLHMPEEGSWEEVLIPICVLTDNIHFHFPAQREKINCQLERGLV